MHEMCPTKQENQNHQTSQNPEKKWYNTSPNINHKYVKKKKKSLREAPLPVDSTHMLHLAGSGSYVL